MSLILIEWVPSLVNKDRICFLELGRSLNTFQPLKFSDSVNRLPFWWRGPCETSRRLLGFPLKDVLRRACSPLGFLVLHVGMLLLGAAWWGSGTPLLSSSLWESAGSKGQGSCPLSPHHSASSSLAKGLAGA